jgi:serine/threonine protein phosphatase PrpC
MVQIGFKTDAGKMRSVNEDAFFVMPKQNIYIIADGVGGQNAGELASRTTVKNIADYIQINAIQKKSNEADLKIYFNNCITSVNENIYNLSKENEQQKGMATTVVILYVHGNKAYVTNVGDSRAYLIREDQIHQITEDHTVVNQLVKGGKISKKDAKTHPMSNVITKAIGADIDISPDYYSVDLCKDDIVLLCSDGLYSEVNEEQIIKTCLSGENMHQVCNNLIDIANEHDGKDNITVICVKI